MKKNNNSEQRRKGKHSNARRGGKEMGPAENSRGNNTKKKW